MKKIIEIVGEARYNVFKEYDATFGSVLQAPSSFVDLKQMGYSGVSIKLDESIGLLLPLCAELYLIYDELWGRLKDNIASSKSDVAALIKQALSPDEVEETERGYLRLWWDEPEQYSGEGLIGTYYKGVDIAHEAITAMKVWLHKNWEEVDWRSLDILMINGDVKNSQNKLRQKFYGPGDDFDDLFVEKPEQVETFKLRLDGTELLVNVNGLEFGDLPDYNVESLYRYGWIFKTTKK